MPSILVQAIGDLKPPFQSSRPDLPDRGHDVFRLPPGHMFSNSTGQLGKGWGEVRCANGVIIAQPTPHKDGGLYRWIRTGPVPELPPELAELLADAQASEDAATDLEVAAFTAAHARNSRPRLLLYPVRGSSPRWPKANHGTSQRSRRPSGRPRKPAPGTTRRRRPSRR